MLINPRAEQYCKEWFDYVKRTANHDKLKPRPNDRIDINIFERCFIGERGKVDCKICKGFGRALMQDYYQVINYGIMTELNNDLEKYFNHVDKIH